MILHKNHFESKIIVALVYIHIILEQNTFESQTFILL